MKTIRQSGMDQTTFRIIDVLSRHLGSPISMNGLTKKIFQLHGTGYYANIYGKVRKLTKEQIITLTKSGKSSITSLNFQNPLLTDLLTEVELRKKQSFLSKRPDAQLILSSIDSAYKNIPINSICLIDPEKNIKLNRLELLFLVRDSDEKELVSIHSLTQDIQRKHSMRIDPLTLDIEELIQKLKSEEANPISEMLWNKIVIVFPQSFWTEIKSAVENGINIKISEAATNPAKIAEADLVFNLARFGYREIGGEIGQGGLICIEYIVTSILMRNEARRIEAIPVILAKNPANYKLLAFLTQKYGVSGRLLGLLKILDRIKPDKEVQAAIKILESAKVREIPVKERSIKEKMRLYNAIR